MMRHRYVYADPCAATEQCHRWVQYDDRCDRNTEPHSKMCALHEDYDYSDWYHHHTADDCCSSHCPLLHEEAADD